MSPSDIEFLLHCYTSPAEHPRVNAPAIQSTISDFLDNGLIERIDEDTYHTTSKGEALVKILCATQMPTQAWIDGNGEVVNL